MTLTPMLFLCATTSAFVDDVRVGAVAPEIKAQSSFSKEVTNESLGKDGGYMLLFLNKICPTTGQTEPYFSKMTKAYGQKSRLFVVADFKDTEYSAWNKKTKAPFPVIFDPKMEIIRAYNVESGPTAFVVGKDSKVEKFWVGYSATILEEINQSLAGLAGLPVVSIDLSKAPKNKRYGCTF